MQLGLSENLSSLVARRFTAARDAGHLIFSQTHLATVYAAGIPCQLRYCPALAKKPSGTPKPDHARTGPKPDPFHNPSPELLIAQIPQADNNPAHLLVLNKFPVIPNHFILATKAWKPQTDLLEKDDLEAAYACIKAWGPSDNNNSSNNPASRPRLFAFFNSGDESGASQPHRHLQFLPVEAMSQDSGDDWRPLIDAVAQSPPPPSGSPYRRLSQLPFAHFALPLSENPSADELHATYLALYRAALATSSHTQTNPPTTGPAAISYNLAMTESTMMICPRKSESAQIAVDTNSSNEAVADAGIVALNGTILAGTLMVKAEAEWNELRRNPESLARVLAAIGFPHPDLRHLSVL
ncbi:HIT-like protein [Aspergillus taichungensis]|uniref:HIT-like protein n=1 Tax=Aspergillus taichungensis TaxID=482145 RepID=A0A2J5HZH7_9EURO|nr:HIT-like protein [Aspergillus taichungensis]